MGPDVPLQKSCRDGLTSISYSTAQKMPLPYIPDTKLTSITKPVKPVTCILGLDDLSQTYKGYHRNVRYVGYPGVRQP